MADKTTIVDFFEVIKLVSCFNWIRYSLCKPNQGHVRYQCLLKLKLSLFCQSMQKMLGMWADISAPQLEFGGQVTAALKTYNYEILK